jgi:hypothetical protein
VGVGRKAPLFHLIWQREQNNFVLKIVLLLRGGGVHAFNVAQIKK